MRGEDFMQKIVSSENFAEQFTAFSSQISQKKTTDAVQISSSNTVAKKMMTVAIPTANVSSNVSKNTTTKIEPASEPKKKNKSGSQKAKNKKAQDTNSINLTATPQTNTKKSMKTEVKKETTTVKKAHTPKNTKKKIKKNKKSVNLSFLTKCFDFCMDALASPILVGIIAVAFISVIFMSCI